MKLFKILFAAATMASLSGCTKLEETLNGQATQADAIRTADIDGLLKGCYTSFRGPYQDQTGIFCLEDMSSDNCIGPTRAGDWDDNGVWRVLHTHTWNAENQRIRDNFNNLLQIVFNTTNLLNFNPSKSIAAEARMLRAYAMFTVLDLYDQVPVRQPGEDLLQPSKVLKGTAALDQIISDLNIAMPDLSDGPAYKANKWAAKALLMKCYLNKGVYANRVSPTFDGADMDKVIALGTEIQSSGKFNLENYFYTNFAPNNGEVSKELIFTNQNSNTEAGNVRFHWHCGTHYNQTPGGWNGFTTLASFYDKFDSTDQRRGVKDTVYGFTGKTGMRVGMLIGQQFNSKGEKLKDRGGNDLVFTRDISPIVSTNIEAAGIRVVKYVPDMKDSTADKDNADNDYVLLRYSDVLLMSAEALHRKGSTLQALALVNSLRAKRKAPALTALTDDILLDERGRELYWESWRRNDMIRFKKFLLPYGTTKPGTDDPKYLVFPIPSNALAVNPNLSQNPGY